VPAVRQAGGLNGGRGLDAGHLDRGVVLQLRCLELGECSDQRRVEADGVRGGDPGGRRDGGDAPAAGQNAPRDASGGVDA
jgi:hypothetical protein